ncbi:MAG: hypothetical protein HC875_30275 [Anaerolineales bacterium]|nr:hypothetical protein [Anaerolineales bacterium]
MSQSIRQQTSAESDWKNILWREWRNSEDEEYANHLLELLISEPIDWRVFLFIFLLDLLFGMIGGLLAGYGTYTRTIIASTTQGGDWAKAFATSIVLGGLIGGSVGLVITLLLRKQLLQYTGRDWYFWWAELPQMAQVETALQYACLTRPKNEKVWATGLQRLAEQRQQPDSLDKLVADLRSNSWVARFVASYGLVFLGGEAVETLQTIAVKKNSPLSRVATRILKQIEIETTRLAKQASVLVCPRCLMHYDTQRVYLTWQPDLSFYGCRNCHQSRSHQVWPEGIVLVLDTDMAVTRVERNSSLYVSWFQHCELFDFDRVEIIQASDEEVERFAVQVGNDTDPYRKPRYSQMTCRIGPDCQLSENTLRILERMFGKVEHQTGIMHESIGG